MVVFKIHGNGILTVPPEADTPRAVDVHRIPNRPATELVKIKTGHVHILRDRSSIQSIEAPMQPYNQFRSDF